ncbi:MAG TPA: triose-phosphate isomerase [Bacteroidetes bacterium]|nr:triose-phosphate isomerase [Bacteroidota bacterium]
MRKKIVAGNWKMNKTFQDAEELLAFIAESIEKKPSCEVVACPPSIYLELATDFALDSNLFVGAQNVSQFESGAYTGEISAAMLDSVDVDYCIVGHSERRKYFHESDEVLAQKVDKLLDHNIIPIFCCGEQLEDREKESYFDVVKMQLKNGVFHLNKNEFGNLVIAYEPIWAIGTGRTATPAQAQEMHNFIRNLITKEYGKETAGNTTILYGGSCNPGNARELFSQNDVDGGLIGGASLKGEEFIKIVNSF